MSEAMAFIGIDPTAGARAMTYAVLDDQLHVRQLGKGSLEHVVEVALSPSTAVCGIDAPAGPNLGLMADPAYRERLGLDAGRSNYSTFRVCEFELRRRGIFVYNTPPDESSLASWMQEGRRLYQTLRDAGYVDYPRTGRRRLFETYPHAAFTALAKGRPYPKNSLEGLLQRQLLLYEEGIDLPDPMRTLEEWTRHRLLKGQLDLADVHNHDELDALVAAYTAFVLVREPQHITVVGDPAEGQIILPVADLLDAY